MFNYKEGNWVWVVKQHSPNPKKIIIKEIIQGKHIYGKHIYIKTWLGSIYYQEDILGHA